MKFNEYSKYASKERARKKKRERERETQTNLLRILTYTMPCDVELVQRIYHVRFGIFVTMTNHVRNYSAMTTNLAHIFQLHKPNGNNQIENHKIH